MNIDDYKRLYTEEKKEKDALKEEVDRLLKQRAEDEAEFGSDYIEVLKAYRASRPPPPLAPLPSMPDTQHHTD